MSPGAGVKARAVGPTPGGGLVLTPVRTMSPFGVRGRGGPWGRGRGQRVVARRVVEADMRGLVTAGPCVRLERCAGLRTSVARFFFVERDLAAHSLGARCSLRCGSSTVDPTELEGTRGLVGQHRQGPAPAGQFAGDGDVGDHRPFLAQVQVDPAGVQPLVAGMSAGAGRGRGPGPSGVAAPRRAGSWCGGARRLRPAVAARACCRSW